jgi:hypothetical protein
MQNYGPGYVSILTDILFVLQNMRCPPEPLFNGLVQLLPHRVLSGYKEERAGPRSPCLGFDVQGEKAQFKRAGIEVSFDLSGDEEEFAMQDMRDTPDR